MKHFFKSCIVDILTFEAKMLLRRTKPTIIGVTGSVGKTSVKDAIYAVLKDHVSARKSDKSFNSELGVPLTILGLRNAWSNPYLWLRNIIDGFLIALVPGQYPKVLVLEMGVDRPGDMKRLTSWIKPDIVVFTRLPDVPVHVEFFKEPSEVIAEKLHLLEALKPDGIFVYNNDDEHIRDLVETVRQQSIGYSRYSPSHFIATGDQIQYDGGVPVGISFYLQHLNDKVAMYVHGALGVQHAYNYAAAAAVASLFEIPLTEVSKTLKDHVPPPGRMRILKGIKGSLIIDDTYNSSPVACERALMTLRELKGVKRRITVLGDMLELGQYSVREHERIGELVAKNADMLITVGVRARKIAESAMEFGMSEKVILQYDDILRAGKELQNKLEMGDVVLVKASQGIRAEVLVEEIMAEPARAEELLVRQDPMWKRKPIRTPM